MSMENTDLVVFASGGAPDDEAITASIVANNFSDEEFTRIKFFYFQSGVNYERMDLAGRSMMGIYRTMLRMKKSKSAMEDGMSRSLSGSYDVSRPEQVKPIVDYVNALRGIPVNQP